MLDLPARSLSYSVPAMASTRRVSSRKFDGCRHVAEAIIAAGGKATAIACHIGEIEQISQVFAGIKDAVRPPRHPGNSAMSAPFSASAASLA